MDIEVTLYQAIKSVGELQLPVGISSSGKQFEDFMVKQLHTCLSQIQDGYRVFPPRHTLRETTYSGVFHQFDIVIAQEQKLIAVECKFRETTHIDQLFSTKGKLIDYKKPLIGIFLTTANHITNDIHYYAFAQNIQIICNSIPPVEFMLRQVKKGSDLEYRLEGLRSRISNKVDPHKLLVEWKNASQRFIDDGYE